MTDMHDNRSRILIVSLPGIMQNVLKETFTRRVDVDLIGVASGGLSAVGLIKQKQPDLVVIDSNLPGSEASALISWIKEECQHVCSLVLAETTQQMNKAVSVGADITLRSYSLPENLDSVMENLRSSQNNR